MSRGEKDPAESIRHRLRDVIRERGEDVQFGLQRYAAERFLFRLGRSPHRARFVLKGAMLFSLWTRSVYRPTRDLDFTGYGSNETADLLAAVAEICATDGGADGIVFDVSTLVAEPIRDDAEYHGLRVRFAGRLGGSRVPMQIDIGFGNHIEPPAEDVRYPTLLGGEEPRIRAYPTAAVVAEKLHAMVVLGERNSRIKDFYDVYVLARTFAFDGATLQRAVAATFARRATPVQATLPIALTPAFYEDERRAQMWRAYQAKNGLRGAPAEFARVGEMVRGFLSQLLLSVAHEDRHTALWAAGGPWTVDVVAQGATVVISVSGSVAEVLPPADEDEVGPDHREDR